MLVNSIKLSMRISTDKLDDEIKRNIDTCLLDMQRVGVKKTDEDDELVAKAAELYTKWQLDYEGQAERYRIAYEALRDSMSMCRRYKNV